MLEQLADYSIPVWHPILVHFPVALAWIALGGAFIWLFRDRQNWLRNTIYLEVLALLGAFLAVRTGETMEEQSEGVPMIDQFVGFHETMGERSMWLLAVTVAFLIFAHWYSGRDMSRSGTSFAIRVIGFLLVLGSALSIGLTAHAGGIMTWGTPG